MTKKCTQFMHHPKQALLLMDVVIRKFIVESRIAYQSVANPPGLPVSIGHSLSVRLKSNLLVLSEKQRVIYIGFVLFLGNLPIGLTKWCCLVGAHTTFQYFPLSLVLLLCYLISKRTKAQSKATYKLDAWARNCVRHVYPSPDNIG
ncbi:hypothetical protein SOVF_191820 [Spinacia oleracea]|nr:hypothetical protein SOVF_191820 [Spinacia oleracea]